MIVVTGVTESVGRRVVDSLLVDGENVAVVARHSVAGPLPGGRNGLDLKVIASEE